MQTDLLPGDLDARVPDLHARCVRHRPLRRGARAAQPRGPAAAPRDPDDDPGGVGEPRVDGRRAQGVLPLPRVADGAVGRPRVDRVHRRHRDRRGARPQRPAPVALLGHRRRPRDHGERGRRARRRRPSTSCARAGSSRARSSSSTRRRGASSPTTRSRPSSRPSSPYQEWLDAGLVHLDDLPPQFPLVPQHSSAVQQQRLFGYTQEDLRLIIAPMARNAVESLGSMGTDTPVPVLSDRPRMLYEYFKQLFAQVTNPPLDANFEALVTSLNSTIGPEGNLLDPGPESCRQIVCPTPILTNEELAKLRYIDDGESAVAGYKPFTVYCHYPVAEGGDGLRKAIDNVRTQVSEAIADGANLDHPLRPLRRRRARADPGAAHHRRRAPPPRAREDPHPRRARRRDRRGARGAPLRAAARVRRRRDQPVPRVRHDPRPGARGRAHRAHRAQGDQELREGRGQGHPQGDVEDGHLHGRLLHRRADLRGGRAAARRSSTSTSPAPRRASRASTST